MNVCFTVYYLNQGRCSATPIDGEGIEIGNVVVIV